MTDYKVTEQLTRARKAGLPATLTQEQWASTLKYFNYRCAYCLKGRYNVIEHFIPLRKRGGTTYDNCVPACWACNSRKDNPRLVFLAGKEALDRVRSYLLEIRPGELIVSDQEDTQSLKAIRKEQEHG